MTLPSTYADTNCSLARSLEIIGERWTLMIIRDAFFGLRRFGDFAAQLKIPRAVLANRLKSLVHEGVLIRVEDATAGVEYRLTDKGVELWPIVHALMNWGTSSTRPQEPNALCVTIGTAAPSTARGAVRSAVRSSRSRRSASSPDLDSIRRAPMTIPCPTRSTHLDDSWNRS